MSFTALTEEIDAATVKVAIDTLRSIAVGDIGPDGMNPSAEERLQAAQTLVNYAHALR